MGAGPAQCVRSQDRVPHWPSADLGLHLNLETLGGFLGGRGGVCRRVSSRARSILSSLHFFICKRENACSHLPALSLPNYCEARRGAWRSLVAKELPSAPLRSANGRRVIQSHRGSGTEPTGAAHLQPHSGPPEGAAAPI